MNLEKETKALFICQQSVGTGPVKTEITRALSAGLVTKKDPGSDIEKTCKSLAIDATILYPGHKTPARDRLLLHLDPVREVLNIYISQGGFFDLDKREALALAEYLLEISKDLADRPGANYTTF